MTTDLDLPSLPELPRVELIIFCERGCDVWEEHERREDARVSEQDRKGHK